MGFRRSFSILITSVSAGLGNKSRYEIDCWQSPLGSTNVLSDLQML